MRSPLLLAALPAALALGSCGSPKASITPFLASVGLDGDIAIGDNNNGTVSSSFDQLGIEDEEAVFGGLVRLGFGGTELSVSGYGVDFEGTGTAEGTFEYDGNIIVAGTDVNTKIDLQTARALFTWDIIPGSGLDIGIGIGATLIDLKLDIEEVGGMNSIETDELIPVPLIGARVAWTWGPVDLRADAGGLVIEYDEAEAAVYDVGIQAAVDFLGIGDLVAGYKFMKIDAKYEDSDALVDADLDLNGYYVGLTFGF